MKRIFTLASLMMYFQTWTSSASYMGTKRAARPLAAKKQIAQSVLLFEMIPTASSF